MFKINLETPITTVMGEQAIDTVTETEGKIKRVKMTLRYCLQKLLGARYDDELLSQPREYTWIYNLACQVNQKDKVIEVSEEKIEFLRKLLKYNGWVIQQQTQHGIERKKIEGMFSPFQKGQLMVLLGDPDSKLDK